MCFWLFFGLNSTFIIKINIKKGTRLPEIAVALVYSLWVGFMGKMPRIRWKINGKIGEDIAKFIAGEYL